MNTDLYLGCGTTHIVTVDQLTRDAIAEDKATAENAIRQLRARGPEGLKALLDAHADILTARLGTKTVPFTQSEDATWQRLRTAIDGVSQQRDCYASQLYWYTDFEQAKVAAKNSAKPILSLRLLGKLDEEFSCANSRFFRTTLYANHDVAQYLKDHFILHWKTVRPVPKVTIDFGDGRKLEQTITGNSIHYILDGDGKVIDALPGLYGARAFLTELQRDEKIVRQCAETESADAREKLLREFHESRVHTLNTEFVADVEKAESTVLPAALATTSAPSARTASGLTRAKNQAERRLVHSDGSNVDDVTWQKIAMLHSEDARLDQGARALISAKMSTARQASVRTTSKAVTETPLLRQMRSFERNISEDTARNEYLFHTRIHEWLAAEPAFSQVDALNRKVYAELFLTPDTDPWLGLLPDDYTALEGNGIVTTK